MSQQKYKYVATRPLPTTPNPKMGPRKWAYHQPVRARSTLGTIVRRLMIATIVFLSLLVLAFIVYKLWVDSQAQGLTYAYDAPNLPHNHVALVMGAGLNASGGPSAILYDRVATATDLYKEKKVDKLLMTGDNSETSYNEVEVMRRTAVGLGVPDKDIVLDYAGFNTWDSCYRAREVFGLKAATVVTQKFHLPRALHTCNYLGVKSIGVTADRQHYDTFDNEMRELPALFANAIRVIINDRPRFLGDPVDVDQPQR
ncbi:MAG TPA: ElyC/SanA/YdcF family protein [Chloroflexia bacterium]|nr:ElyC/SanA/YdcF family protein [Chloroflexia bacterium]